MVDRHRISETPPPSSKPDLTAESKSLGIHDGNGTGTGALDPGHFVVSGVGVLDKTMFLLNTIEYRQPVALPELTEATGFSKTTTQRLVSALEAHGLVHRDETGSFVTGGRFATDALMQVARPVLAQLSEETGESTQLFVRRGNQRMAIVSVESSKELRATVPVGVLLSMDEGSAGQLLAGDQDALRRGWAESVGKRVVGVSSVSAPLFDDMDRVAAAVCLSGPTARLGSHPGGRYSQVVMTAAEKINALLISSRP